MEAVINVKESQYTNEAYKLLVEKHTNGTYSWSIRRVTDDFLLAHGIRKSLKTAWVAANNSLMEDIINQ